MGEAPPTSDFRIPATPLEKCTYSPAFYPSTQVLSKGSIVKEGFRPLDCDILLETDKEVRTRDGTRLYGDVYRPRRAPNGTVPAILAFAPFGKQGGPNRHNFGKRPWRCGVSAKVVSGLETFEGPDPAYWVFYGYAVVCVDMRGCWHSEGDISVPCTQQGQDGYDVVEWIAQQPWCNGKVTMQGNSFLAATQWWIGVENPPHLACLAPWEGFADLYNDMVCRGGFPDAGFSQGMMTGDVCGKGRVEDFVSRVNEQPLWNDYWEDRKAKVEKIRCPLYIVASWTNPLHTRGTIRAFVESGSQQKWLRVHNTHEWPDLYYAHSTEDLRTFYDHFMKGANNGWEFTPRIRMSVVNPGGRDIVHRPEQEFPLARQKPFTLFLNTESQSMSESVLQKPSKLVYDASTGSVTFDYTVTRYSEFIGHSKLRLWVEADGSDDMDLFVSLEKFNSAGELQRCVMMDMGWLADDPDAERMKLLEENKRDPSFCSSSFSTGPIGGLRVSHRALDEKASTEFRPIYTHSQEDLLRDGEAVPVDIEIWPYGWIFDKGDKLRLEIAGFNRHAHLRATDPRPISRNKGKHIIHSGKGKESFLLLPLATS